MRGTRSMNVDRQLTMLMVIIFMINCLSGCGIVRSSQIDTTQNTQYGDEDSDEDGEEELKPVRGGSIAIPLVKGDVLNPLISSSKDVMDISGLIFEGLVTHDDELRPAPALAESWSVTDDGKTWAFNLREGVKWHDGRDFTVDDVIFTINALRSGVYDTYYAQNFNRIDCIERVYSSDNNTLYIKLRHPVSYFLDSMIFPVLPRHIYEGETKLNKTKNRKRSKKSSIVDNDEGEGSQEEEGYGDSIVQYISEENVPPIGTGPYKVAMDTYSANEDFTLVKNDNYWDEEPYIGKIEIKVYNNSAEAINAFQIRQIDVLDTNVVFAETYAQDDVNLYRYLTQNYEFLAINHQNPILSDIQVRKALAYGIDRNSIIKETYLNNAEAIDAPIPSNSWLYDGSFRIYDCDIDRAIELLEDAGWHDTDGDGIRDKEVDGKKLDLSFKLVTNSENDLRKDVAEDIKRQLGETENKLGIQIDIEIVQWEELKEEIIPDRDFDILLTGYNLPVMPDLESLFASYSHENFMGYSSEELDALILKAKQGHSEGGIKEAYSEIQSHFTEQLPVISLYFPTSSVLISKNIGGKICPRELDIYRDIQKWYITDRK